ncbi:hypothetical protein ACFS2C_13750 [Prauserella oleivorans]|uniref:Uncharacterized protein n=1 Tax=Prauserella oleivorans TaxID=1478153 RepID=A0ABW5W968_9PSEU
MGSNSTSVSERPSSLDNHTVGALAVSTPDGAGASGAGVARLGVACSVGCGELPEHALIISALAIRRVQRRDRIEENATPHRQEITCDHAVATIADRMSRGPRAGRGKLVSGSARAAASGALVWVSGQPNWPELFASHFPVMSGLVCG